MDQSTVVRRAYEEYTSLKHEKPVVKNFKYPGFADIDGANNDYELWAQWYATHGRSDKEFVSARGLTEQQAQTQLKIVHDIDAKIKA
jgi:hypothetical protein